VERILGKVEGVTKVDANVETKKVVVTHTEAVSADEMLAKLMKWSQASGKSVALAQ